MDCTHRDQVVFAYSSTMMPSKSRPLPSRGLCNVVDSFHATRGAQMKTITKASGLRPRMEQVLDEAVVWRYLDKFIAAVLKDKQTVNKPLTPANYGGVWPPIKTPPRGLERSYAMMPTQPALPDTADQPHGNTCFSCMYSTSERIPRNLVTAVVPSVKIHFLPRPHWSALKLRELLQTMQSFPTLAGAMPYPISSGGIQLPQSAEQRAAFGGASRTFSEREVAQVRGFAMPWYTGAPEQWREEACLTDDSSMTEDILGAHGDGRYYGSHARGMTCPSMNVWAKCGPTLQQMRDVMSALETCGHLLIATNLTRVGPFKFKAQQFYTTAELRAMTCYYE